MEASVKKTDAAGVQNNLNTQREMEGSRRRSDAGRMREEMMVGGRLFGFDVKDIPGGTGAGAVITANIY